MVIRKLVQVNELEVVGQGFASPGLPTDTGDGGVLMGVDFPNTERRSGWLRLFCSLYLL